MGAHSCFPEITFPTGVNNSSGATLIDSIFCKLTPRTIDTFSGIFLDQISDHFLYLVYVENIFHKQTKSPKYHKKRVNSGAAIQNMIHVMEDLDIGAKLNPNPLSGPNLNYDILHDHIAQMKIKHLPYKLEKFHKYKKNKWITYGILRST